VTEERPGTIYLQLADGKRIKPERRLSCVAREGGAAGDGYTREEMVVLASLRRRSGRTCRNCRWYAAKGNHRGCFPEGKYRKWLSPEEYASGCDKFAPSEG